MIAAERNSWGSLAPARPASTVAAAVAGAPSDQRLETTKPEFWPSPAIGGRAKRVFDVIGAAGLLVFLAPVFLAILLLMAIFERGPAFYGHMRIGFGGRRFTCLKFRSMVVNSDERLRDLLTSCPHAAREWAETRKLRNDPRITWLGKFLRRSSLDELPQLINVLRGEMSLVGPRPVTADELDRYGLARVHYLRVRPGLTGLWQVSGRSNTSYQRRVELDKNYALRWSFIRDVSILLRTVPALLGSSGAV